MIANSNPQTAQPATGDRMNELAAMIRTSSDNAGVMQAAFQALSITRPDLAVSLSFLPATQQAQVLTAYANAVRTGQQALAHEVAAGEMSKISTAAPPAPAAQPKPFGSAQNAVNKSGAQTQPSTPAMAGEATSSGTTGIGVGAATTANRSMAFDAAKSSVMSPSLQSLAVGLIGGPVASAINTGYNAAKAYNKTLSNANASTLAAANESPDPIGTLAKEQGWTDDQDGKNAPGIGGFNSGGLGARGQGGYGEGRSDGRGTNNSAHGGDAQA